MEEEFNRNDLPENGQDSTPESAESQSDNARNGSEETRDNTTYGAVYTPLGSSDGEYSCRSYVSNGGAQNGTQTAAPVKKSRTGAIVGVCVFLVIIAASLTLLGLGVVKLARDFAGYFMSGTEESTTALSSPEVTGTVPDHTGDKVAFAETGTSSGLTAVTVERNEEMSFVDAVAAVKDSVVEIRTEQVVGGYGRLSQYIVSGAGSGVIISEGGLIITNHHVIEGASKITVAFTDGTSVEATLIGSDDEADIAVLSVAVEGKELKPAVIGDSDQLLLGETVLAIGNPLGELGGSVSRGIISSKAREVQIDSTSKMTLIQTDAAINPGNSGGALFNLRGELIGIVNAKSTGDSIEGLGFAIPINTAWSIADSLIRYGYVPGRVIRSIKGVTLQDNYEIQSSYGSGIVVTAVDADSAFKVGDVITAVEGVSVSSVSELQKALRSYNPGDKVRVRVSRQMSEGFFSYIRSGNIDAIVTGTELGS